MNSAGQQGRADQARRNALRAAADEALDEGLTTVIVPVRNEAGFIRDCLASILAQEDARLEVLVVDGGSDDGTPDLVRDIAAADPRVRLLHNPERIVPTALNRALGEARGAWLVRVDGHATVPPNYVCTAVQHLATGQWAGVGGRKDSVGVTAAGRAIAAAMGSKFGVGPGSTYHHGTRMQTVEHVPFGAYPTALARAVGGWDEELVTNQDYEFDYRIRQTGRELLFDPALRIDWYGQQSLLGLFRQYRRYGTGKADVIARHPSSARPRQVLPALLVAALAAGAGGLAFRATRPAGGLVIGGYGAAVVAASVATATNVPEWSTRLRLPGAFVALHVGWGIGLLRGAVRLGMRGSGDHL